ncbi:MAG: D-alanine--D-alanine ligase, partial [Flavobacteriaceae bacterium]|nr:D-alanine--D-alanine ligase [Flavobacteriaceae bacterium]
MTVKKVAVVMGGYSSEAEISKKSGSVVIEALSKGKYDPYAIYIERNNWYHLDDEGRKAPIDRSFFSCQIDGQKVVPDIIFNTVHGTPGEDGYLQAYWELLGIPQTSASFYSAALSFNKRDSLSVLKN